MRLLQGLLTFFVILPSASSAIEDIKKLARKTVGEYPRTVLVEDAGLVRFYWNREADCGRTPGGCDIVINQENMLAVQEAIKTEVLPRLEKFRRLGVRLIPEWKSKVEPRLFPLNIRIVFNEKLMNIGSSSIERLMSNSLDGKDLGLIVGPMIHIGGNEPEKKGILPSLIMHEFGHMLLRALGFPQSTSTPSGRIDALLEEALSDYISRITNDFTPYMAPGLQDEIRAFFKARLSEQNTETFYRAVAESHLQGLSAHAVRDFAIQRPYSEAYVLPGHYLASIHFNSAIYRLEQQVDREALRDVILIAIAQNPSVFMHGELNQIISKLLSLAKMHPKRTDGWRDAQPSPTRTEVAITVDKEKLKIVPTPNEGFKNLLFPSTVRSITYTIYRGDTEPIFSFANYLEFSSHQHIELVPKAKCEENELLCFCGQREVSLVAVYLDQEKILRKTVKEKLNLSALQNSACHGLTIEWD